MSLDGMDLKLALTLHPRVISQDAGGSKDIHADVIVERFMEGHYSDGSLLDACAYHLAVIRHGKIEESMICKDYGKLEDALIANVHGGRELAYDEHWVSIDAEKVLHYDTLRELVRDNHTIIQRKLNTLVDMIDKQDRDHGRVLLSPPMARMFIRDIAEIEQHIYNNATLAEN